MSSLWCWKSFWRGLTFLPLVYGGVAALVTVLVIEWHCEYINHVDQCKLVAVPVTDEKGE